MAWEYGFYNSVNGDRTYNADQISSIFKGLITNGVYESVGNKLAVQPNNGMTIQIATGRGWFNDRWVNNSSEYLIVLEASDVLLNRYAAVCIRSDVNNRTTEPYIKYSEFATTPVKPTMERSDEINEYCLAYVYIGAGVSEITAANIEDTRGNTDLCGWVTGLIKQVSTSTLLDQYKAIYSDFYDQSESEFDSFINTSTYNFNSWFGGLQNTLDENTEAMLVNALPTGLTVILTASGWTQAEDGTYTQDATVTNMTSTKTVLVNPSDDSVTAYSAAEISCTSQSTNTLTFTAITAPTTNINVDITHMGV